MATTRTCARDELSRLVKEAADDLVDTVTGKPIPIVYDDVPDEIARANPPISWARLDIAHQTGVQEVLAGADGRRRYTRTGLLTVQLFTPSGDGRTRNDEYATAFQNALQGQTNAENVTIRNVSANEVGISGPWAQTNIVGTFEYDEFA